MSEVILLAELQALAAQIDGEVYTDDIHRKIFATDASVYRELPIGVAFPKSTNDLKTIVEWSYRTKKPLIPRAAGTSLAGQVVGNGLVVDTGRYLNNILHIDPEKKIAVVQPGVIRDELNKALKPYGLFFAPETSSSNRCMIGGMVGNNACGARSLVYGSTRDHLLEVKGFLSSGEYVVFGEVGEEGFFNKCEISGHEGDVYRFIQQCAENPNLSVIIANNTPWPEIRRRNTGYALDELLDMHPFHPHGKNLNLAKLVAGSEGTLMMISELTLALSDIPEGPLALLCLHCHSLEEAFHANILVLKHQVLSVELVDRVLLDCTKDHPGYQGYRFFIEGDPEAVVIIEIQGLCASELTLKVETLIKDLMDKGFGYHYPVVTGDQMNKVWELRKAGLGLLSNVKGDARPVPVAEDTAVRPMDLPAYMDDFRAMLKDLGLSCVFYAHIGTGELHLRPVLNLKDPSHKQLFREVATRTASLVKKYRGSLSGEHGDGRLRGEFIRYMVGEEVYDVFLDLKRTFDSGNLLNPGKITSTPPMDTSLRYDPPYRMPEVDAMFRSHRNGGLLKAIERCNGSADCRRPAWLEGVMSPSYQASGDERLSTRGRADFLRETLTCSDTKKSFKEAAIKDFLSLCLSCKGCKTECPSAVDMAMIKAEVLNVYYHYHNIPLPVWLMSNLRLINRLLAVSPSFFNRILNQKTFSALAKRMIGVHPDRNLPPLSVPSMKPWLKKNKHLLSPAKASKGRLVLFLDEFTRFYDADIAVLTIKLLTRLGYEVIPFTGADSGRAALSEGLLPQAKKHAERNVKKLKAMVNRHQPLVGIEPSALLVFRDEYPELVSDDILLDAQNLASNSFLVEEFLAKEFHSGNITHAMFLEEPKSIRFHGHCHQKALGGTQPLKEMLQMPLNYNATEIKSGCCGMAGTFGMMKENYALSMSIGELTLFPTIRNLPNGTVVVSAGTGCRMQLKAGTGKQIYHPVEVLFQALKPITL